MTVSSELNRKQYAGNGVTTSFATSPVTFFDSSDLDVYVVTTATGAATTLTETTDYTVTGGSGSTGTVSLAGLYGAPSASQTLVIVRNVPLTQAADFVQNDASDAEVVEDALDKLTMAIQQVDARVDRSFVLADSDVSGASLTVPTPAANNLVGWNSAATGLENKVAADLDLAIVTAFIETLLDDATAADARTTLDTPSNADLTARLPAGTILDFAGTAVPTGFLACDGSAVSRTTYATLFAAISTTWGVGDGTTTFNVPDLRGRAAIGSGTGSGLTARTVGTQNIGEETHVLTEAELASHTHTYTGSAANNGDSVQGSSNNRFVSGNGGSGTGATLTSAGTLSSTGSGTAHNNMQPSAVVLKIIKI